MAESKPPDLSDIAAHVRERYRRIAEGIIILIEDSGIDREHRIQAIAISLLTAYQNGYEDGDDDAAEFFGGVWGCD